MTKISILLLALLAFGCEIEAPPPPVPMTETSNTISQRVGKVRVYKTRITVERVGTFDDTLAYARKRGVYIIKDSKTGAEYIGVSGIGIAEVGSHYVQQGKTQQLEEDER